MKKALPEQAREKPLEIWFQDEARVGQKGSLTRIWAKRGTRPRAPRDTRYASAYLFGAVCPARKTGAGIVMPRADTNAFNEHLAVISRAVAAGSHAAIIMDGAGWHVAEKLAVPDNITLIKLPPYAPELNAAENIWEYLRKNKLALRVHENYEAIVDVCCAAWNDLMAMPERIASIATRDWASVS